MILRRACGGVRLAIFAALCTCLGYAQPADAPKFDVVSVKPTDPPPNTLEGVVQLREAGIRPIPTGCYVGPSRLQYNCKGSVPKLLMEALNLSDFQYKETGPPMYLLTAKLTTPATREQMDALLLEYLQDTMGVQFHREPRTLKGIFLTVTSRELLTNLPLSHASVPPAEDESTFGSPATTRFLSFSTVRLTPNTGETAVQCRNISFPLFAQLLYRFYGDLGRIPVIDATGLNLRFDLDFHILTEEGGHSGTNLSEIRQKLAKYGIGLQLRVGTTDLVVVDHVAPAAKFLN